MKTALVTGASSGIGYELSKLFGRDGYKVILVARREEELKKLAEKLPNSQVIAMDISKPGAPRELLKKLEGTEIDVLVNNAGYGLLGEFSKTDLSSEIQMIHLNILSLTELTKLVLPQMLARRSGKILNVASTAAFQPGPLMAVYYATKAYVLSFSEAIAEELRDTGVTVTTLCPGPTRTEFADVAKMGKSKLFKSAAVMDAAPVAEAGYEGLMAGKRIVVPGIANRMMIQSLRVSPRSLVTKIVRRVQEEIR